MKIKNNGLIICGFAGIGKSTFALKNARVVDLESTPFERDWKRYVKVAKHMADNKYIVLVSCHAELRKELKLQNIQYTLALPNKDKKKEYIERYKNRQNTEAFIKSLHDNWDNFLLILPHEKNILIVEDYLQNCINVEVE